MSNKNNSGSIFFSSGCVFSGDSSVVVDGRQVKIPSGRNVSIVDGVMLVDGKRWTSKDDAEHEKNVRIADKIEFNLIFPPLTSSTGPPNITIQRCKSVKVNGDVNQLNAGNTSVSIAGSCRGINTSNGRIDVKSDVHGSVSTSNAQIVVHGSIHGSASTSNATIRCTSCSKHRQ